MTEVLKPQAPEVLPPQDVATPVAPEQELILAKGTGIEIWKDAASTFVPVLKKDLTPAERQTAVRSVMQQSVQIDDRLNLVHGEMLFEVAANGYYKDWENPETGDPYKTFEEYTETELSMKKSKAHYLKKIYRVFVVDLDLDLEQLRNLEWSKAKELTEVITKSNAKELIDKIGTMSVRQVKDLVNAMKGKTVVGVPDADGNETGTVTVSDTEEKIRIPFVCAPEQAENITSALKIAQSMTGSDVPSNNLDLICTDFQAGAVGGGLSAVANSLDRIVEDLQRAYGVTIKVESHDAERYDKLKKDASDSE